jgi:hypothetical protein
VVCTKPQLSVTCGFFSGCLQNWCKMFDNAGNYAWFVINFTFRLKRATMRSCKLPGMYAEMLNVCIFKFYNKMFGSIKTLQIVCVNKTSLNNKFHLLWRVRDRSSTGIFGKILLFQMRSSCLSSGNSVFHLHL